MILEQIKVNKSLITIGCDCFAEALGFSLPGQFSSCFIISQQNIWNFHGATLEAALKELVPRWKVLMVEDGEQAKNLESYANLLGRLADAGADRKSLLIVLGGGVVGDLSGFVAATYMRGQEWLYIPTTLLAQQDASVGGKTAVNLAQGKNLVGSFWDPLAVIIDCRVLETLPQREVNAGYMEFLKHGMLHSPDLYRRILAMPPSPNWPDHLGLLADGLKVKLGIVTEDPFEKGVRRLLNLGHTFGHALESYTRYRYFLHGEAVGLGLIFSTLVARHLGGDFDWSEMIAVVQERTPAPDPSWDRKSMLDLTLLDKKGVGGVVSWIIPFAPGKIEIVAGVEPAILEACFDEFMELLT